MNKRKLPQWLLDAVANSSVKHTKNDDNHNNNSSEFSHGTVTLVPLSNLLSQSSHGRNINPRNNTISHPLVKRELVIDDVLASRTTTETQSNDQPLADSGRVQPVIKTELLDDDVPSSYTTTETQPSDEPLADPGRVQAEVKTEIIDENMPSSYTTAETQASDQPLTSIVKKEIKEEPRTSSTTGQLPNSSAVDQKVKTEVTLGRRSCNYGAKCFRRNPSHRTEFAHPGDLDYRRPQFPDAQPGTPPCPWGASCCRRNPQHFIQLSHLPVTTTAPVRTNVIPLPQTNTTSRHRRPLTSIDIALDNDDDDDNESEDKFTDGSSDEYVPNGEDSSEDDFSETQEQVDT